jgi:hypothetical protein
MSAIICPVHFHRDFERRWATRMAGGNPRRSRREGTDTCECGNVVTAPSGSSHSPAGVINKWWCAACGRQWETAADLSKPSRRTLECQK